MATQMNPAALAGLTGIARRLVIEGTLADADARKAVDASSKQKIPLGTYLIEHALANGTQVAMASSAEFGVPLFDVEALDLMQAPIKLISEKLITQHKALPLFKRGNRLFVGVSDPIWGEVGHAFVVADGPTVRELDGFLRERLANYKVPKRIWVVGSLPTLPIGKVDKAALRRIAEEQTD